MTLTYWRKIMIGVVSGIGGASLAHHNWLAVGLSFTAALALFYFWEVRNDNDDRNKEN